jgi:NTE family protein
MKRLTWPRYSLLDHTVFDRALKHHYGETEIEDLWTGYFAVSTCIASNTLCLITRGPVWKAVRATSSIPGLLPPVYYEDGRMLVDGSLLDNVPVKSIASSRAALTSSSISVPRTCGAPSSTTRPFPRAVSL